MFKRFYDWLVPETQRPVLHAHPLAFWFSLGVVLSGLVAFSHPAYGGAPGAALPTWLPKVFNACWTVGGGFSVFGITPGKSRYEAAGMALLSTSFITYFLSIAYIVPSSAWTGGFLISIAIGCARRAYCLAAGNGYEKIIPDGDKWVP